MAQSSITSLWRDVGGLQRDGDIHIMLLNMDWENLDFELPSVPGRIWLKAVDTSPPPPLDIADLAASFVSSGMRTGCRGEAWWCWLTAMEKWDATLLLAVPP
jgi:hypothetical protein